MRKSKGMIARVFIPSWVKTALTRENIHLNTIFNLVELKNKLSREDLAVVYCMNTMPSVFLGTQEFGGCLKKAWAESDPAFLDELEKTLELYLGLKEPRLNTDSTVATGDNQTSALTGAFEIIKTDPVAGAKPTICIIIKANAFKQNDPDQQKALRSAFLTELYDFLDIEDLAEDPVFSKQVEMI